MPQCEDPDTQVLRNMEEGKLEGSLCRICVSLFVCLSCPPGVKHPDQDFRQPFVFGILMRVLSNRRDRGRAFGGCNSAELKQKVL